MRCHPSHPSDSSELCPAQAGQGTPKPLLFSASCTVKVPQGSPGRGQKLCLSPAVRGRAGSSPVALQPRLVCSKTSREFRSRKQIALEVLGRKEFPWRWGAGWVYFRLLGGSRSFPNEPVWSPSHDFCPSFPLSCVGFGGSLTAILSSHGMTPAPAWKYPWSILSIPS